MTERHPLPERIAALCCECGTPRDVSFRYAGSGGDRDLRCAVCRRTTRHAPVRPEGWDWREAENRKSGATLVGVERDLAHIRSLGILVDYGRPQGGKCMINRYLEPDEDGPEWRVIVQEDLPVDVLRRMVTWAWRVMLPSYVDDYDEVWNGPIVRDKYGEHRGAKYTGD